MLDRIDQLHMFIFSSRWIDRLARSNSLSFITSAGNAAISPIYQNGFVIKSYSDQIHADGHQISSLSTQPRISKHLKPIIQSSFTRLMYSTGTKQPPSNSGGASNDDDEEPVKMTLHEAVLAIADAAVSRVELGDYESAIAILQLGIQEFSPRFPSSPELGELHNQIGLLSLLQDKNDQAAEHAQTALNLTSKAFGEQSVLTGHRLTRLGSVKVAQGKLTEAREVLSRALVALQDDVSLSEAKFYISLTDLSVATHSSQVHDQTTQLLNSLAGLIKGFGSDSIVLSLALKQHEKIADRALAAQLADVVLCEALLKQHCQLVHAKEPSGEPLAVAKYRYATFLYANDLLSEAASQVKEAVQILRGIYPPGDDHPPLKLCMHRLGMICAASGDHRSANKLLTSSLESFRAMSSGQNQPSVGSEGGGSSARALAVEAEFGLALSSFRAIDPTLGGDTKTQVQASALGHAKMLLDELCGLIGDGQMLAQGANRFYSQLKSLAAK